jgi:hypothetical protein
MMNGFIQTTAGLLIPVNRVKALERRTDGQYAVVTLDDHRYPTTYEMLARSRVAILPGGEWQQLTAMPDAKDRNGNGRPARIAVDAILAWHLSILGGLRAVTLNPNVDPRWDSAKRKAGSARVYPDDPQLSPMDNAEAWLAELQERHDFMCGAPTAERAKAEA